MPIDVLEALEVVTKQHSNLFAAAWLVSVAAERRVLRDAWTCVQDGESYPRASAVLLAASLAQSPAWWPTFLQDCGTTEVGKIFTYLFLPFGE